MPSTARSDIARSTLPTTVPVFDMPGGGLRIPGHLVSASPTNMNAYMALNR
jgi:hypothetical protein